MKPEILSGLRLKPGHTADELRAEIARQANMSSNKLHQAGFRILHKSIDARRKTNINFVYTVEVNPDPLILPGVDNLLPANCSANRKQRPVVVGAGPAGLFAALYLARAGFSPLLVEQGKSVESRVKDVDTFWTEGRLNPFSNVQFGEGGAGTFSDGKLTTNIKNPLCRTVLEEMVLAGAPEEILYLGKPHIGTDRLRRMLINLRQKIIACGGRFLFSARMTGLELKNDSLRQIFITTLNENGRSEEMAITADHLILAAGHSARDTFSLLQEKGVTMQAKPFSLGLRIEHTQQEIDEIQYGDMAGHTGLPPADYKLAVHLPGGRSVYTFCMCPGGQVIAAASEKDTLAVNGMSQFARDRANANSALLVSVTPDDFPFRGPLGGVLWQRELEAGAYALGGGGYLAPCQRLADFSPQQGLDPAFSVIPSYKPGIAWCDLASCLPDFVTASLRAALPELNRKMPGFANPAAVLTAIESRSSSPVRICRSADMQSNIAGIYPCGEGAGYAGGIMSAAVDGLRCAAAVIAALT